MLGRITAAPADCAVRASSPSCLILKTGPGMSLYHNRPIIAAAIVLLGASSLAAQQPATPLPGSLAFAPAVGTAAPDFTLPGATRYGLLKEPIKLSNYRGQTVVLAFFPKARTKG